MKNYDLHTIQAVKRMATGFVSFPPRALQRLNGVHEDMARDHCEMLVKSKDLRRVKKDGETWYQERTKKD